MRPETLGDPEPPSVPTPCSPRDPCSRGPVLGPKVCGSPFRLLLGCLAEAVWVPSLGELFSARSFGLSPDSVLMFGGQCTLIPMKMPLQSRY